jgi:hypothetical protein
MEAFHLPDDLSKETYQISKWIHNFRDITSELEQAIRPNSYKKEEEDLHNSLKS